MSDTSSPLHAGLIYLGGTIGCSGQPLAPLDADDFFPRLQMVLEQHVVPNHLQSPLQWHFFSGSIKDSSALTPEDWADILALLLDSRQKHIQHWIILHGTDTLAYTAAFLATALSSTSLKVVLTGSQLPLLHAVTRTFDPSSDALGNLQIACQLLGTHDSAKGWVRVAFNHQHWAADQTQKIHTRDLNAFSGLQHTAPFTLPQPTGLHQLPALKARLATLNIQIFYALPQHPDILARQLEHLLDGSPEAIILLAYGMGNLIDDLRIHRLLLRAEQSGIMVILSTQVPHGGVESRYAAGNWLTACGVLPAQQLPVPTIFARLAWLLCHVGSVAERRKLWLDNLTEKSD